MGQHYEQLSLEERCTIAHLRALGQTLRQIATALARAPSTIARELKRNGSKQVGYLPAYAAQQARGRCWRGSRMLRQPTLQALVLARLARGWSPAQVAGRLKREHGRTVLSHETIYRFIDAQIRRTNDYRWRHSLPRGKSKRGWRGRRGGSPIQFIRDRVALHQRPPAVQTRREPGYWEADLMLFAKYGQAVLVAHERHSRWLVLTRQPHKSADAVVAHLLALFTPLPAALRQTITFDNGTEFARHHRLHRLAMQTFFCDPHAPWQKGGIENAIGRLRRGLPRKTDLATLPAQHFTTVVALYNHTPRQCLAFQTPAEVFLQHLLHFKCESTFRLAPE
jgi:IS30 family transposase